MADKLILVGQENAKEYGFRNRTCGLVWEARSDYLVWKVGLDKAYTAFIADKPELPSSLLSAVLLTIL